MPACSASLCSFARRASCIFDEVGNRRQHVSNATFSVTLSCLGMYDKPHRYFRGGACARPFLRLHQQNLPMAGRVQAQDCAAANQSGGGEMVRMACDVKSEVDAVN